MKDIVLLKGSSQYDAMRIYIDELQNSFQNQGYNITVFDCQKDIEDIAIKLDAVLQQKSIFMIFTCNGVMLNWFAENKIYEKYNVFYATIFFDHPMYHYLRLKDVNSGMIIFFADMNHVMYAKRYFLINNVYFVPVSGSKSQVTIPYEQRKNELIFTGSYFNLEKIHENILNLPDVYKKIAFDLINILLESPQYTIEQAMVIVLQNINFSVSDEEFNLLLTVITDVDLYVRGWYRDKIIKTIAESGHRIHIYGNRWDEFSCKNKENLILHEGYGKQSLEALADSKISLNVMPWFRAGFQERIAAAMLNGAVAFTDSSTYIDTHFVNNENIVLYSLRETGRIPDIIDELIRDEEKAAKIAGNGHALAEKEHTWDDRGRKITEYIRRHMEKEKW